MTPAETGPEHSGSGTVSSGEIVELDYELWSDVPGGEPELIDTTRESAAAKTSWKAPEGHTFGARPHLVGGEFFPSGIESALVGAKVGKEFTKEFPPAEAFGEKDPKLIELFSMHEISRLPEMRREDSDLNIGTVLTIHGRRGRVVSMTAARVRMDFNPAFSGRKIRGTFEVVKVVKEPADQVRGILEIQYGRGKEFQVEVKGKEITIQVPDRSKFDIAWLATKPRVIERIRSQLKPHSIQIIEEYLTPTAKEGAEKTGAITESKKAGTHAKPSKSEEAHSGHAHASGSDEAEKA
jgi:FKBP-type peptidyl-prolyl cis-trans isomerase SlyD